MTPAERKRRQRERQRQEERIDTTPKRTTKPKQNNNYPVGMFAKCFAFMTLTKDIEARLIIDRMYSDTESAIQSNDHEKAERLSRDALEIIDAYKALYMNGYMFEEEVIKLCDLIRIVLDKLFAHNLLPDVLSPRPR